MLSGRVAGNGSAADLVCIDIRMEGFIGLPACVHVLDNMCQVIWRQNSRYM
jgi:hypothetical protein